MSTVNNIITITTALKATRVLFCSLRVSDRSLKCNTHSIVLAFPNYCKSPWSSEHWSRRTVEHFVATVVDGRQASLPTELEDGWRNKCRVTNRFRSCSTMIRTTVAINTHNPASGSKAREGWLGLIKPELGWIGVGDAKRTYPVLCLSNSARDMETAAAAPSAGQR